MSQGDDKTYVMVSVGISAYNEEKNIQNVLKDVLSQKEISWRLKEVIVYCDGCTDKTKERALGIHDLRVNVIEKKERSGKSHGLNEIFARFGGEVLVLFDADVRLKDDQVITALVKALRFKDAALVGGNTRALEPVTFFERSVYSTFYSYDELRKSMNSGKNIFTCNGGCMALRGSFAGKVRIPPGVRNDDSYIYFLCRSQRLIYEYEEKAVVFYKLPKQLKDYLRQVFRSNPESAAPHLKKYFSAMAEKEYHRPVTLYLKCVFRAFVRDPLPTIFISAVMIICRPFFPIMSKNYKLQWWSAQSTK